MSTEPLSFIPKEIDFSPTERKQFLDECMREASQRIEALQQDNPEVIRVPLDAEQLQGLQLKGLNLYQDVTSIQRMHLKRTYPAEIDIVHIYSGPFTAMHRGMEYIQETGTFRNPSRSRDNDRVDLGLALVREVARSRLREKNLHRHARKLVSRTPEQYFPYIIYNGQPSKEQNGQVLHENDDLHSFMRNAVESGLISETFRKNKVLAFDTVKTQGGDVIPIKHTGHQVDNFIQETIRPEGHLYSIYQEALTAGRPMNVAVVSHNSGMIRIPFYFGLYKQLLIPEQESRMNLFLYGVRDRSAGIGRQILKQELVSLATYAACGFLATDRYLYTIPTEQRT